MAVENKQKTSSFVEEQLKKQHYVEERQNLLFSVDDLIENPVKDKDLEKYTLINGTTFTLKETKQLIEDLAQEYQPMFSNDKPFFSLMYKLLGWEHLDSKQYIKPPIVATYIKRYIYGRFDREVLPTLLAKENPLIIGYIKKYKLFQFLNEDGLILLEGYIQDAINVMQGAENWYDFELKYTNMYNLSVQLKLIPKT